MDVIKEWEFLITENLQAPACYQDQVCIIAPPSTSPSPQPQRLIFTFLRRNLFLILVFIRYYFVMDDHLGDPRPEICQKYITFDGVRL